MSDSSPATVSQKAPNDFDLLNSFHPFLDEHTFQDLAHLFCTNNKIRIYLFHISNKKLILHKAQSNKFYFNHESTNLLTKKSHKCLVNTAPYLVIYFLPLLIFHRWTQITHEACWARAHKFQLACNLWYEQVNTTELDSSFISSKLSSFIKNKQMNKHLF